MVEDFNIRLVQEEERISDPKGRSVLLTQSAKNKVKGIVKNKVFEKYGIM